MPKTVRLNVTVTPWTHVTGVLGSVASTVAVSVMLRPNFLRFLPAVRLTSRGKPSGGGEADAPVVVQFFATVTVQMPARSP